MAPLKQRSVVVRLAGLWHHPDFMKLWIGQTISEFGSRISRDGIPLAAVIVLGASPNQMGFLVAITALPIFLLGLLAGVWVDRLRRRPIMIAADVGRFLLLLTIPIATLAGRLSFGLLCVISVATGVLTLFFNLAYHSVLPSLISREHVLEGNSKLATTEALAEIGGPTLSGVLITWISAPFAIFFDAISFLFSAVSVAQIRTPEPTPEPKPDGSSAWKELREGLSIIAQHRILRIIALGTGFHRFFGNFFGTLYALYAIRELGLSPASLGFLTSMGGVGSLLGAFAAEWLPRRFGLGRAFTLSLLVGSLTSLLTPLAGGPFLLIMGMLTVPQLIGDGAMTIFAINDISLRQMIIPDRLLGRANATLNFLSEGVAPIGAVVAGFLATAFGAHTAIWIAVIGLLCTSVWMLLSPVTSWKPE